MATALFVGHNPGIEEVVRTLSGEYVEMPTAALVQINFDLKSWVKVGAKLGRFEQIWRPKDLDS